MSTETPDEALRRALAAITGALAADLLDRVHKATPALFEKLIVELLQRETKLPMWQLTSPTTSANHSHRNTLAHSN